MAQTHSAQYYMWQIWLLELIVETFRFSSSRIAYETSADSITNLEISDIIVTIDSGNGFPHDSSAV